MAIIDVTYSQMKDAEKQLTVRSEEYNAEVRRIAAAVQELRSQWEGDAQAAFDAEQAAAMMFYRKMSQRVVTCAAKISQASAQYQSADHAAAELIRAANH